jgi:hypothetical protein
VGQFDGFALVIDTHGGRVRIDVVAYRRSVFIKSLLTSPLGRQCPWIPERRYHRLQKPQQPRHLTFGHCDYSYRNLGRPSIVKLKHTSSIFEVTIDDKLCFSTNKVCIHRVALRPCRGQIYRTNLSRSRCPLETPSASQQPLPKIQTHSRSSSSSSSPPQAKARQSPPTKAAPPSSQSPIKFLTSLLNPLSTLAQKAQ